MFLIRTMIDFRSFENIPLRGGFVVLRIEPAAGPLRDALGREAMVAKPLYPTGCAPSCGAACLSLTPLSERWVYRFAAASIDRSHSSRLPRNPSSQAVCQLKRADIARRFPLYVSDRFW